LVVILSLWITPQDTVRFSASRGFYSVELYDKFTGKKCFEIVKLVPDEIWDKTCKHILEKHGIGKGLRKVWLKLNEVREKAYGIFEVSPYLCSE